MECRLGGARQLGGQYGFNIFEAHEVVFVKGQDTPHAINAHRGYQSGVVDLNARDTMCHQEPSPFLVN